jgi:hypothetical protein
MHNNCLFLLLKLEFHATGPREGWSGLVVNVSDPSLVNLIPMVDHRQKAMGVSIPVPKLKNLAKSSCTIPDIQIDLEFRIEWLTKIL